MARKKRSRSSKVLLRLITTSVLVILICVFFYNADISVESGGDSTAGPGSTDYINFKPDNSGQFLFYIMSTGNSDSLLLVDPGGQAMLVDAADDDDFYHIKTTLDKYGVDEINTLVATHPHADHIGAMDDVITAFDVDTVYTTGFSADTQTAGDLKDAIETAGLTETIARPGMEFKVGDAFVRILGPEETAAEGDANNQSIILLVSYGQTDFLLAGDMEEAESADILERWGAAIDCEILKVAHHGSETGTSQAFLDTATPDIAVISCGEDNPYGHPDEAVLSLLDAAGAKTLRTDQMGDIAILTDGTSFTAYEQFAG